MRAGAIRTAGVASALAFVTLFATGCPPKPAAVVSAPPSAPAVVATPDLAAAASATAEVLRAEADRQAAARAAAGAAIAQAEKDFAEAKEAKAALFAYDLYQAASDLLATARLAYAKPEYPKSRDDALASSEKSKAARAKALASKGGPRLVVKKGNTLWKLAADNLHDPFLWPVLYKANLDLIGDPNRIFPAQELALPGSFSPDEGEEARKAAAAAPGPKR